MMGCRCLILLLFITSSSSFNVETRGSSSIKSPAFDNSSNIRSTYFGYSFLINKQLKQGNDYLFLIGSPKSHQPSDQPNGTAPYKIPQYDEKYASGTLHSCPLALGPQQQQACSPARPVTPINPLKLNNRDAIGSSIAADVPNVSVCTPNEAIGCPNSYFVVGSCYHSKDFGRSWSGPVPGPNVKCSNGIADLFFILDSSESVSAANFELIKNWVINVSEILPTDSSFHVGVVVYDETIATTPLTVNIFTPIQLQAFTNLAQFQTDVRSITRIVAGRTHTAKAINATLDNLQTSTRLDDPNNRQIIILLTDGASNDKENLPSVVARANKLNVTMIAVGVGQYRKDELETITGTTAPSDRIFGVSDFSGLGTIVDAVRSAIVSLEVECGKFEGLS